MKTNLFVFLTGVFFTLASFNPSVASAQEKTSYPSASLAVNYQKPVRDNRAKILADFLGEFNSPLTEYAEHFVNEADKNGLDWKLVAAISGVESYFGHQIPYESYNAWGWGVYGKNVLRFNSWNEAITVISTSLRANYINKWKADDVYKIGRVYAADPLWARKVTFFMNKIADFAAEKSARELSISI